MKDFRVVVRATMYLLTVCLLTTVSIISHARDIHVVGLFKDRAVLVIDGKRKVLSAGKPAYKGVKLITATSKSAILEVDGQRRTVRPELRLGNAYSEPVHQEVRISRDRSGMFRTDGYVNGQPIRFLVDTGATLVALNANHARKLGIDYKKTGKPGWSSTASGYSRIYRITLKSVRIGPIELRNVKASVRDGDHPTIALLGMAFLGKLTLENDGRTMRIRKKY